MLLAHFRQERVKRWIIIPEVLYIKFKRRLKSIQNHKIFSIRTGNTLFLILNSTHTIFENVCTRFLQLKTPTLKKALKKSDLTLPEIFSTDILTSRMFIYSKNCQNNIFVEQLWGILIMFFFLCCIGCSSKMFIRKYHNEQFTGIGLITNKRCFDGSENRHKMSLKGIWWIVQLHLQ